MKEKKISQPLFTPNNVKAIIIKHFTWTHWSKNRTQPIETMGSKSAILFEKFQKKIMMNQILLGANYTMRKNISSFFVVLA